MSKKNVMGTNLLDVVVSPDKDDILLILNQDGTVKEEIAMPEELRGSFDIIPAKKGFYAPVSGNFEIVRAPLLHGHTDGSMLDGGIKSGKYAQLVGWVAAITDHGSMTECFNFWKAMRSQGKLPIIGCEVYSNDLVSGEPAAHHLILLVKNETGYRNLCQIISAAEGNFYRKPQVNLDILEQYHEGLIATSACIGGELAQHILNGQDEATEEFLDVMTEIFGNDFYLEVQRHEIEDEEIVNKAIMDIARDRGIKVIATPDSHFASEEDTFAHEVLLAIGTHHTVSDPKRFTFEGKNYHVPTQEEFEMLWADEPRVWDGMYDLISKIDFDFETEKLFMPHYECPNGMSQDDYFVQLAKEGFEKLFPSFESAETEKMYRDRLDYEVKTILQMGFSGYFLIVSDYIRYARDIGGFVGPGRGSAVGSLCAYCLGITNLDPIPYGLLFERFLNPERVTMPDIDVDFDVEVRDKVVQYCRDKYGADSVGKIITFGTLSARTALRDVGRVMEVDLAKVGRFAKAVPATPKITLAKAMKESKEFKDMYDNDPELQRVYEIATKLEGLNRHRSVHACGVVISAEAVNHYVPEVMVLDKDTKEKVRCTSFTGPELEAIGLLKMDFLGLRNMSVIKDCVAAVPSLPRDGRVPIDDPYVYRMIGQGKTIGVFQVESAGMRKLMKEMFWDVSQRITDIEKKYGCRGYGVYVSGSKDETIRKNYSDEMSALGKEMFERLIAAISLFRPGPMDYIPQYLEGMKNPSSIHYDCPELESILSRTYGVICYQEQVQEICRKLAGYSLGRADVIRRAMGKKKMDVMNAEKETFLHGNASTRKEGEALVPGCVVNGISEEAAQTIWDKMVEFAKYAFNKSHSAGYAVISATTGYLKLYHGPEFIVANLNSVLGKAEEIQEYLNEARAMGIKVLAPSINSSAPEFTLENGGIRVGLMGLKNLGKISQEIIAHRVGEWKTIEDFMFSLVDTIDKRAFESLALAGALDEFGVPRKVLADKAEDISAFLQKMRKYSASEDGPLPEVDNLYVRLNKVDLSGTEEFSRQEMLANELERCGVYVSGHPLDGLSDYYINKHILPINAIKAQQSEELAEGEELDTANDGYGESPYEGETVNICGTAASIKQITTKKGDLMLMLRIEDKDTDISVTVFPKVFKAFLNGNAIQNAQKMRDLGNSIIMVNGRVETDSWGTKLIANSIAIVDENLMSGVTPAVWVNVNTKSRKEELMKWVESQPAEEAGKGTQVIAYYQLPKGSKAMVIANIKLSLVNFLELKNNFVVKSDKEYSKTSLDKLGQSVVEGDWSEIVI